MFLYLKLKTLQTAHERELSSCHETVRILQQRLTERDEAYAMQKRRKVPVDYYALKAKVSKTSSGHCVLYILSIFIAITIFFVYT